MCLLALFHRVVEDSAVVVGANREEYYARGGEKPRLLEGEPRVIAGIDPKAGGTWLGVNEFGVVVAITNRLKTEIPSQPPSRGMLVRKLLTYPSAADAEKQATQTLSLGQYAGCNLLIADAGAAYVIHAGDWLRSRPLPPGVHVLTANDVDDAGDWRIGHALWWLGQRQYRSAQDCLAALKELCAQGGPDAPICLHGEKGGTVSSTVFALRQPLSATSFWHAQGSPDRTPYEDLSSLFRGFGRPATTSAKTP
jgi:uncharacterized protein with NRDE domain